MTTKAIANGTNEAERKAASDANEVQNGLQSDRNRRGLPSTFGGYERRRRMRRPSQQPSRLHRLVSKLNALCRLKNGREIAALIAIDRIEDGEDVEYEVIPI